MPDRGLLQLQQPGGDIDGARRRAAGVSRRLPRLHVHAHARLLEAHAAAKAQLRGHRQQVTRIRGVPNRLGIGINCQIMVGIYQ